MLRYVFNLLTASQTYKNVTSVSVPMPIYFSIPSVENIQLNWKDSSLFKWEGRNLFYLK